MKKKIVYISIAIIVVAVVCFWIFGQKGGKTQMIYVTMPVEKNDISTSVTATGTIEPVTVVEVGTQVSGIIYKL